MKIPFHNGHVLGGAALAAPVIGVYVPLAFAVLVPVTAVFALAVSRLGDGRWPRPPLILAAVFIGLVLWCSASAFWTTDPDTAIAKLPRFIALMLSGLVLADAALSLTAGERGVFVRLLIIGVVIAVAFLAFERITNAALFRFLYGGKHDEILLWISFSRGVTAMVLFAWPVIALLGRRRGKAALVWLAVLGVTLAYDSGAAVMGLGVGSVAFAAAHLAPRVTTTAMAALLGILVLTAPILSVNIPDLRELKTGGEVSFIPRSSYHRLLVWRFTSQRIAEHPLRGWGFESSRLLPGGEDLLDRSEPALPLHPHNAIIQIWVELGLPGALFASVLLVWIMLRVRRAGIDRMTRSAIVSLIASTLTIASLSYGIWQSWWLSVLWLVSLFAVVAWQAAKALVQKNPEISASPTPPPSPPP